MRGETGRRNFAESRGGEGEAEGEAEGDVIVLALTK